jgi:hypothetical protein
MVCVGGLRDKDKSNSGVVDGKHKRATRSGCPFVLVWI